VACFARRPLRFGRKKRREENKLNKREEEKKEKTRREDADMWILLAIFCDKSTSTIVTLNAFR
jgi:hypothetical protein